MSRLDTIRDACVQAISCLFYKLYAVYFIIRVMPTARSPFLGALGALLKQRRSAAGLTRAQLAERSGLSTRFLAQIEAGEGNISVTRLAALAAALGASAG